jgi:hypothetical protein
MDCAECTRLLAEFGKLTDSHVAAVRALDAQRSAATVRDYVQLMRAVDQAGLNLERGRREFQQHHANHSNVKHAPRAKEPAASSMP